MKKKWNKIEYIKAFKKDLLQCRTSHERIMVKAICSKEYRELFNEEMPMV